MIDETRPPARNASATSVTTARREHVEPRTFVELLLSRRHLERADDSRTGTLGLLEPQTGRLFVTDLGEFRDAEF